MGKRNQLSNSDDNPYYALDNREFEDVQSVLSLMRQIRIMMWAYRFDHARYVMNLIWERYGQLLQLGERAVREQREYMNSLVDAPSRLEEEPQDTRRKALSINEHKSLLNEFPSQRKNPYIAVAGITTITEFLAGRLNMDETATAPDYTRFEYGLLQLDDNQITIRTYLFDDNPIAPGAYIESFQGLSDVQLAVDQPSSEVGEYAYPIGLRLFSNAYFAEMMIFAPDYAEILLNTPIDSSDIIGTIIQHLNSTRDSHDR